MVLVDCWTATPLASGRRADQGEAAQVLKAPSARVRCICPVGDAVLADSEVLLFGYRRVAEEGDHDAY